MTPIERDIPGPKALATEAGMKKKKASPLNGERPPQGRDCLTVSRKPRLGDGRVQITPREQQIYCLVAKGLPNKTIALSLGISCWTVSSYLRRLFVKFEVNSRAALVACLMEAGVPTGGAPRTARR